MATPQTENIGLDLTYRLTFFYGRRLAEMGSQLARLHSQLERKRNYVRIIDLKEKGFDRNEQPEANF